MAASSVGFDARATARANVWLAIDHVASIDDHGGHLGVRSGPRPVTSW